MDSRGANYFMLLVLAAFGGIVAVFMIKGVGVPPIGVIGTVLGVFLLLGLLFLVAKLFTVRRR